MQLTPVIAVHLSVALGATLLGPLVLWARLGKLLRPQLHRRLGYTWVLFMLIANLSAMFIRDFKLPNIGGYTAIHSLIPVSLISLFMGFYYLRKKDILRHRIWMIAVYIGGCLGAGAAALAPGRLLHTFILKAFS